jgi:hypothetical protein
MYRCKNCGNRFLFPNSKSEASTVAAISTYIDYSGRGQTMNSIPVSSLAVTTWPVCPYCDVNLLEHPPEVEKDE